MIGVVMVTKFFPPERRSLIGAIVEADALPILLVDAFPHRDDWSLYRFWNRGVDWARDNGCEFICVVNDDIRILPSTFSIMADAIRNNPAFGVVYPDVRRNTMEQIGIIDFTPTIGTWGGGGMTGFCFMFRSDLGVPFDENYQLWYGDDAFEKAVRDKGLQVVRINNLPIDHAANGSTSRLPGSEAGDRIARDRQRWESPLAL